MHICCRTVKPLMASCHIQLPLDRHLSSHKASAAWTDAASILIGTYTEADVNAFAVST
jgi:hypothetical protein